jgi:hypothetical protein
MDIERTPEGMEKRKAYRESIGRKYVEGCLTEQVKNWSTPTVMDTANIQKPRKKNPSGGQKPPLCQEVKNWPTATARDWKGCGNAITRKDGKHRIDNLEAVIKYGYLDRDNTNTNGKSQESWGTPKEQDSRAANTDRGKHNLGEQVHGMCNGQQDLIKSNTTGKSQESQGKLNPDWVEHLMGLPVGWTDLGSWETE